MDVVFNHDQSDYLETFKVSQAKWKIEGTQVSFVNHSRLEPRTACLSSTSKQLLMFQGAEQKCKEVIDSICKDKACKKEQIGKAPVLKVAFGKYEYKFYGEDYLYTQGKKDQLTIECRFTEVDPSENCLETELVVGKFFFNKFVPVLRYKKVSNRLTGDDAVETSLSFLPYFDTYKHKAGLKWAIVGVSIAIAVLVVFIFIIQRLKKIQPEDYHQVQN